MMNDELEAEDYGDRNDLEPDDTEGGDELYEHHRVVVDRGQELLRIDKFLLGRLRNTSRNKVQEAIRAQAVEVNGATVKPNYRVKPGDTITITLPEPPREGRVVPEEMPLDIRYEDPELLIVNKPAGLVVHPRLRPLAGHASKRPSPPPGQPAHRPQRRNPTRSGASH